MYGTTQGSDRPENERTEMALGRCLVDGDPVASSGARRARRKSFAASLAIEILLLVLIVAVPLLTSGAQLQFHKILPPQLTFSSPWRERPPVRPDLPETTSPAPTIPNPYPSSPIPRPTVDVRPVSDSPEVPFPDMPGEDPQGAIQGIVPNRRALFVEPPRIAPPAPAVRQSVKISEGVLQAQLLSRIEPQYPILAKLAKTEGTVRLRAFISQDGRITSLEVISGNPLLVTAALDAVRQWRYSPTMLNGEPVEVETFITVVFRLQSQ
jgi:periplasmic protein TonB